MFRKLAPAAVMVCAVIAVGLFAAGPSRADDPTAPSTHSLNGKVLCPGGVRPAAAVAMQLKVNTTVTDSFDTGTDGAFTRTTPALTGLGFQSVTLTATAPDAACGAATGPTTVSLGLRLFGLDLAPALRGPDVTVTLTAAPAVTQGSHPEQRPIITDR